MGRHSKTEVPELVQPVRDPVAGNFEGTLTPLGDDGAFAPTQLFSTVGNLPAKTIEPGQIEGEHLSKRRAVGLGARAVAAAMDKTYWQLEGKGTDREDQLQALDIQNTRELLANLPRETAEDVEMLFEKQMPSEWLKSRLMNTKSKKGKFKGVISALTARGANGDYLTSDETVLNFLEWHNSLLAETQKDFDSRIEKHKADYVNVMHMAVKNGWIDALPPNLKNLQQTVTLIDDGFQTLFHDRRRGGFARREHDLVVLAPRRSGESRDVITHEFTHIIEGVDTDESGKSGETRKGMYRLFGAGAGGLAMNEAVVEHFSNSLLAGGIEDTNPKSARRKRAVYGENRGLLHALSNYGVSAVDIRYFTAALFENRDNPQPEDRDAQAILQEKLREAFPFTDVVNEIQGFNDNTDIEKYAAKLRRRAMKHKLARFVLRGNKNSPVERAA